MYATINGERRSVVRARPLPNAAKYPLIVVRTASCAEYAVFDGDNLSSDARVTPPRVAHAWHADRSCATHLVRRSKGVQRALLGGLVVAQLAIAACARRPLVLAACAVTFGAYAHFGMQQMMHELAHRRPARTDHVLVCVADALFGLSGPGFYLYYMFHHLRHHATVGEECDPDAAFHALWTSGPRRVLARWVWATLVAAVTKLVLLANFAAGRSSVLYLDTPRLPLVASLLFHTATFVALAALAPRALAYLSVSAACSLGAFAHPCLVFWISQHAARRANGYQPTLSYRGSNAVHLLHLGALRHVEHHDAPLIPFYLLHKVPDDDAIAAYASIGGLVREWLWHTDGTDWMDVGAQRRQVRATLAVRIASD